MKEDYKELVEYLEEKFNKIGEDALLIKTDVAITKEDVKKLRVDFSELKENVNILTTSADRLVGQESDMNQEGTMLTAKLHRHERWLLQVAEKLGIKLEY